MAEMKKGLLLVIVLACVWMSGCSKNHNGLETNTFKYDYGVFLSAEPSDISYMKSYRLVVLDAMYFSEEDIQTMHEMGQEVYSYLNVGSLEDFRDYYEQYSDLCLGDYENWPEEQWVDVSQKKWQEHTVSLAEAYAQKGIDGFFIDNCDVYYNYPSEEIFEGLSCILKEIHNICPNVLINGGDMFVTEYLDRNQSALDIMSGVNQECLFSSIDFEKEVFRERKEEDFLYFEEYVKRCAKDGQKVYLLEYTKDEKLIAKIRAYCDKQGFGYYISPTIELNAHPVDILGN